jgi:heme/copper-type cytochrome/quinol oxidase subunit 4
MKQRVLSKFKADTITLVLAALLAVAAVWLVVDQFVGAKNVLEDRLFSFALGINLGNALRLLSVPGGGTGQGR